MTRALLVSGCSSVGCGALLCICACGSHQSSSTAPSDASTGDDSNLSDAILVADTPPLPEPDVAMNPCRLGDGSDPVALCTQGILFTAEVQSAYVKGHGIAGSWDALTGVTSGHAWQDDLGLASSIASYHCGASYYGNGEYTLTLDGILPDLAAVLEAELPQAPDGYDGEIYFQLRNAEAGYFYVNDDTNAAKMAQLADDYGRAIQTKYVHLVPGAPDGGAPDAAPDATDAGRSEAGAEGGPVAGNDGAQVDAGSAGGAPGGLVLGMSDPSGAVTYAPAQAVMGAAALLDMAVLHAADTDAGADPQTWQATAVGVLDYVWRRGRDPATGLFYQLLVASQDATHDALASGTPTDDALLTDVQGPIMLGLQRAQDRYDTLNPGTDAGADAAPVYPAEIYTQQADALLTALLDAKLWDGDTAAGSTPGAFMEGLLPSAGNAVLTNKTTFGNAYVLGGAVRLLASGATSNGYVLGHLLGAFLQTSPANSSFLTVVTTSAGYASQQDYLRASSRGYGFAISYLLDGGAGGQEPGATSYRAGALAAMAEGINQRWRQHPNASLCAP